MDKALQALQTAFYRQIVAGEAEICNQIESSAAMPASERVSIYANAYWSRLVEVLATDYPALQGILGEEDFTELGNAYIAAYPSTYFSLRWFGRSLATFLATQQPWQAQPWLAELAAVEWAFVDAFNAAEAEIVTASDIQALAPQDWPGLSFRFHPSVACLDLHWCVMAQWQAYRESTPLPAAEACEPPQTVLFWRHQRVTRYRVLEVDEAPVLRQAMEGANFATLCELLADSHAVEAVALRAASLLKRWLTDGLVCRLLTDV